MAEGGLSSVATRPCGAGHNFVKIVFPVFGKINTVLEKAPLLTLGRVEAFNSPGALNRKTITIDRCYEG